MMPQQKSEPPQMRDVFGFQVPIENYYLHRGHAWAVLEGEDRVRVGLDDFSQKLLGRAEEVRLPEVGKVYYQDHLCLGFDPKQVSAISNVPRDSVLSRIASINPNA